ncbi:MAG: hypothetical protein ACOZIN_13205 [Myxococcota bacterium]
MEVVIRPVNDRFLREVVFPAFERGVVDAVGGLEVLLSAIGDEKTRVGLEALYDSGITGSFFSLDEDCWVESVYQLLFNEWRLHPDGWRMGGGYAGYAGDWEGTLHLALMLEDPGYPYDDPQQAAASRWGFLQEPRKDFDLASLVCGSWNPVPAFPPDQVLPNQGQAQYRPAQGVVVADWSWRPMEVVNAWGAQLPNKLSRLLGREKKRLAPVEAPETHEVLDYWLGHTETPPLLAVTFSGLGPTSSSWIREIGALARMVRDAATSEQGLTAIITRRGRTMADGSPLEHADVGEEGR